ncbi:chromosome transmission fidelity protein 18 homolog, partial [Uloborus diversus]|uniref:chromosome transmission fidelity protein 18 homolog n=1 Tax=Uloborus diversus TaxID=327109 RepID=UPI002409CB77
NSGVKRKLSFGNDVTVEESIEDRIADIERLETSSHQGKKRQTTHESNSAQVSVKKRRTNLDVNSFLKNVLQTQARSSLFDESTTTFLKDQITLTRSDGRRIYITLKDEEDEKNVQSFSERTSSLLSTSIDSLKSKYFMMEEERILHEKEMALLEKEKMETAMEVDMIEEISTETALWVEKYRPLSYIHLLSEEGINRTLLQWLKLWDKVVFGKEKKKSKVKVEVPKKNSKFQKQFGELNEELDEHGRPYHKVAFLSGPPGLGKTTLAVIIAKHAGYNVVEINASDDRSPESFRTSLEAATQMKAVLHEDHRPNCLVLDEIDGAPAPSINVLLSFIKSTGVTKGKRKKGDIPLLTRPLICICNDQYTPALKPLRQLALVLNFPPTTASRLTSRLNEIALKEGLRAEMSALAKLCEKASNDIRSCLSTLQFIYRLKKELRVADLEGIQIGQKDIQKSLFAVWLDIFYCAEKKSFNKMYNVIQAFGDAEKVNVGIFENYLNIKLRHRSLESVASGVEWLCFGDIIQQQIAQRQLFFLMPYLPYPAVAFHLFNSSPSYPQISFPSAYYENKAKISQSANTLTSMIKDMVSSLKTFLNPSLLILDIFPFLLEIIKPSLRPVSTQLYSQREMKELQRVIQLMLAFNLNYRQERLQDGTYNYVLEPNVEELIKFGETKSKRVLTYAAKQMIAREVEMEQMRKEDKAGEHTNEKVVQKTTETSEPKKVAKKNVLPEKPMVDFFGRVIIPSESDKSGKEDESTADDVWFRFKEGYTNAVRKTVYIKDLL